MSDRVRSLCCLGAAVSLLLSCGPPPEEGSGLILTGGRIYPTGGSQPPAQAMALEGDRIAAIGTDAEIRALAGDSTQEMELEEAAVLPGLYDAWIDLEALGRWQDGFDLRRAGTPREVQARLREAAALDDSAWIVGWGWDESIWPRPELPDHTVLDAAVEQRPVVLLHRSDQLAWLNLAAMEASGIAAGAAGAIAGAEGNWAGLVAGPALAALRAGVPTATAEVRGGWLAEGGRQAAAAGITNVSSAPLDGEALELLLELERNAELNVRVEARVGPDFRGELPDLEGSTLLTIGAVGIELDGPFGPRLAALREPYADGSTPGPDVDAGLVERGCATARRLGLRLDVHVHGDAALAAALRCELLTTGRGLLIGADLPAEVLADGAPGVRVAAVPQRLGHDLYFLDQRLGQARAQGAHPLRDLLVAGQLVAFASLAPRYPLAPMASTWVAWTRQDLAGYPLDGWNGPQRIAVRDAMQTHIAGRWLGTPPTLAAGAVGDLVVWSVDPLEDSDNSLPQARAMVTMVAGRVVYSRPLVQPGFEAQ